ncbi:MAG: sterol desaturase family protein, partial [Deltaproteobacteria bacterium]|nr:sterol desaturase family protein [Deltaproteobacteria bacterium]
MKSLLTTFIEIRFPKLWMPMALYIPLGTLMAFVSLSSYPRSMGEVLGLFAMGILIWTLIEYILHRFLFHEIKLKDPWKNLISAFHLSHHQAVAVQEPDVVITRPAGSLPFAIVFYFLFALMTWSFSAAALIEVGIFAGYLAYVLFYFCAHHFSPKTRWGKFLKNY